MKTTRSIMCKHKNKNKNKTGSTILKTFLVLFIYGAFIAGAWLLLKAFHLDSIATLRELCDGTWGYVIFLLLQIFQVIFIPINSIIFTIPAIIIFGSVKAFLISYAGLCIGSILMFLIGRYGGMKIMKWIVGEEKTKHYAKNLGRGKFILPIFLLIPIFPDDILCISAGLSNIKLFYFTIVILITRAIDLSCTCFIGSAAVKSPLGIVLLSIFVLVSIILAVVLTKHQAKVEKWFVKTFEKK